MEPSFPLKASFNQDITPFRSADDLKIGNQCMQKQTPARQRAMAQNATLCLVTWKMYVWDPPPRSLKMNNYTTRCSTRSSN